MDQPVRRASKQRKLILETLLKNPVHPSAESVYAMLKPEHPELSLGTVYRNLKLLAELGEIQRVGMDLTQEHYDGNITEHYHMVCSKCGKIVDVRPGDACGLLQCGVETEDGHLLEGNCVLFQGICKTCRG